PPHQGDGDAGREDLRLPLPAQDGRPLPARSRGELTRWRRPGHHPIGPPPPPPPPPAPPPGIPPPPGIGPGVMTPPSGRTCSWFPVVGRPAESPPQPAATRAPPPTTRTRNNRLRIMTCSRCLRWRPRHGDTGGPPALRPTPFAAGVFDMSRCVAVSAGMTALHTLLSRLWRRRGFLALTVVALGLGLGAARTVLGFA